MVKSRENLPALRRFRFLASFERDLQATGVVVWQRFSPRLVIPSTVP
jgi:hypothetical protein